MAHIPVFMRKKRIRYIEQDEEFISDRLLGIEEDGIECYRLHDHGGFRCYAPEGKSEAWVDRRIEAYKGDVIDDLNKSLHAAKAEFAKRESGVSENIRAMSDLAEVLAKYCPWADYYGHDASGNVVYGELKVPPSERPEAPSYDHLLKARAEAATEELFPVTDDPGAAAWAQSAGKSDAKVDEELAGFEGMVKFVDGRIADKLYEDFSMRIGSIENLEVAGAGMRFSASYLAKFAHAIAQHVYWETRSRTLRDRAALIDALVRDSHGAAKRGGWYRDVKTGAPIERNFGEMIALAHSELSEALEADRKDLMDDKLPQYHGTYVELIDAIIRELDTLGMLRDRDAARDRQAPSVGEIYVAKRDFNDARADHKPENRAGDNGKRY